MSRTLQMFSVEFCSPAVWLGLTWHSTVRHEWVEAGPSPSCAAFVPIMFNISLSFLVAVFIRVFLLRYSCSTTYVQHERFLARWEPHTRG